MFKKHPGKKVTESAEAQPNSVQTAGKTAETEGDFAGLFLCRWSPCARGGVESDASLFDLFY